MRAYRIEITNQKTGEPIRSPSVQRMNANNNDQSTYSSMFNGQSNPGALNVEFDIPVFNWAAPKGGAAIRIWGVSIAELSQSFDLTYQNIKVYGGMQKGLPLANPEQFGLLVQGTIYQAFGNWNGTDMALDLQIIPPQAPADLRPDFEFNFVLEWEKNTPLAGAIEKMLKTAYPSYTIKMAISDDLKVNSNKTGYWKTLSETSKAIKQLTLDSQFQGIAKLDGSKPYTGVNIKIDGRELVVYDGTKPYTDSSAEAPREIQFRDMIGQPTWLNFATINFKTVMRADIKVGDYIRMPRQLATPFVNTAPGAAIPGSPSRNNSIFQGMFLVINVHHFGNFRQGDASSWVTVFDAVAITQPSGSNSNVSPLIVAAFNAS